MDSAVIVSAQEQLVQVTIVGFPIIGTCSGVTVRGTLGKISLVEHQPWNHRHAR